MPAIGSAPFIQLSAVFFLKKPGGDLKVESIVDEGTRFTIRIPVKNEENGKENIEPGGSA
jgi:hypothetical protein